MRSGTIRSSAASCARGRRPDDFNNAGLTKNLSTLQEPHRLFGRLVELDGLPAPGRERPVAASRLALGLIEYRPRQFRQLSAADRLDDGQRRGSTRQSIWTAPRLSQALGRRPLRACRAWACQRVADDLFVRPTSRATSRAASISIGSTTTAPTTAAASTRTARASKSRFAKATAWRRRATPIRLTSKFSPTSNCAGGGTTRIRRSMHRRGRRLGSARPANRVAGAVQVDRFARIWLLGRRQGDQSAERLFRRQTRPKARRPSGRSGTIAGGLGYLPRRDDTIAVARAPGALRLLDDDGNNRRRAAASRCCNWPSAASGIGTRGRFRPSRPMPRNGATPAIGRPAIGRSRGSRIQLVAAGADRRRRARGPIRASRALGPRVVGACQAEILDPRGEHVSGRSSRKAQSASRLLRHRTDLRGACARMRSTSSSRRSPVSSPRCRARRRPSGFLLPDLPTCSRSRLGPATGPTVFPLMRTFGGYSEAVQGASGVSAVYLNGVRSAGRLVSFEPAMRRPSPSRLRRVLGVR